MSANDRDGPRCISTRMPCRGCYGPISKDSLPIMDYIGALASVGYDPAKMPDRRGYLSRFQRRPWCFKKLG
jgi:F420-non-reducing hydrogenase small subunit